MPLLVIWTAGGPGFLLRPMAHVGDPRKNEEEIRETVDEGEDRRIQAFGMGKRHARALGTPTNGACDVESGRFGRTARKNEVCEPGKLGIGGIDATLEEEHVGGSDGSLQFTPCCRRRRKFGSDDEQAVLDAGKKIAELCVLTFRRYMPEVRIQFVDAAIRLDAQSVFRDSLSAEQRCLSFVSGAGVDFHGNRKGAPM